MLLQRVRNGADAMSAREALEIATRGGAEVLGRGGELGSIEPGKRADLAIWDVSGLGAAGAWDPVAALVLCGPFQVRDLVVEGRRVVREGRLAGVEIETVLEAARPPGGAADGLNSGQYRHHLHRQPPPASAGCAAAGRRRAASISKTSPASVRDAVGEGERRGAEHVDMHVARLAEQRRT